MGAYVSVMGASLLDFVSVSKSCLLLFVFYLGPHRNILRDILSPFQGIRRTRI
jgi:hypothetical protein